MVKDVVIAGPARTPIGSFNGSLSTVKASDLGGLAIKEAVKRSGVPVEAVEQGIMGNVLQASLGQNTARQAVLSAGLGDHVVSATINEVCGSGMKSMVFAAQTVQCGDADVVVAGGMENMTAAPYLLPNARNGYRMGNGEILDSMVHDGLWNVYTDQHMGVCAEECAKKYEFTRELQDDFAVRSYTRSNKAISDGVFAKETFAVEVGGRKPFTFENDEEPVKFNEEKMRGLRPAFLKDGTITAGNASSINDGAAAMVILDAKKAEELNIKPVARIVGYAGGAHDSVWFTTAPVIAVKNLLNKIGWNAQDVDLWEINEAFSVVTMAAEKEFELDPEKVNIYGGAVSMGHPIGCSGTRIMVTLMNALANTGKKKGIGTLCIGGGEGIAMAIEMF